MHDGHSARLLHWSLCQFVCSPKLLLPVGAIWSPYSWRPCRCRDALDALGLNRYCCRRMLMTHVDLIEKLLVSLGELWGLHAPCGALWAFLTAAYLWRGKGLPLQLHTPMLLC